MSSLSYGIDDLNVKLQPHSTHNVLINTTLHSNGTDARRHTNDKRNYWSELLRQMSQLQWHTTYDEIQHCVSTTGMHAIQRPYHTGDVSINDNHLKYHHFYTPTQRILIQQIDLKTKTPIAIQQQYMEPTVTIKSRQFHSFEIIITDQVHRNDLQYHNHIYRHDSVEVLIFIIRSDEQQLYEDTHSAVDSHQQQLHDAHLKVTGKLYLPSLELKPITAQDSSVSNANPKESKLTIDDTNNHSDIIRMEAKHQISICSLSSGIEYQLYVLIRPTNFCPSISPPAGYMMFQPLSSSFNVKKMKSIQSLYYNQQDIIMNNEIKKWWCIPQPLTIVSTML
jgi:hypothetical protein